MKKLQILVVWCVWALILCLEVTPAKDSFFRTLVTSQDNETGEIKFSNGSDTLLKPYRDTFSKINR